MTVREVDKRKGGSWPSQNLDVQRPRDSSIIRGPAYERKRPRFLALRIECECV